MRRHEHVGEMPRLCGALRDALAAYALDALDPAEAAEVEAHLEGCARCREEVASEHAVAALLPLALEPCEPPPEALARTLRRVHASRRRWWAPAGSAVAGVVATLLVVLLVMPDRAETLGWTLESPDVAVISLFSALDSPLSAHYEYQTAARLRYDRSVGRLWVNTQSGAWKLTVHGLPRPPRGAYYVLTAQTREAEIALGRIERWEEGVAMLSGEAEFDLTSLERLSLELVSVSDRVRLLDAAPRAW